MEGFRGEDAQCDLAGCGELRVEICLKDLRGEEAQCELKLSKSDPLAMCASEKSGEHVIAGCGELQVESGLKDSREEDAQCEFTGSDPVVSYCETLAKIGELESQVAVGLMGATGKERKRLRAQLRRREAMRATLAAVIRIFVCCMQRCGARALWAAAGKKTEVSRGAGSLDPARIRLSRFHIRGHFRIKTE